MISTTAIPSIKPGIGAQLQHPVRQNCARIGMAVASRANKRINVLDKVFLG